jgi:hypothetical protein
MKYLRCLWNKWKAVAHSIGLFQSRIILTLFYFIIMLPAGIVFSFFKNELGIKNKNRSTGWIGKKQQCQTLEEMRRQY